MSKHQSRKIVALSNASEVFWNQAVEDTEQKISTARARIRELEKAKTAFLRNAAEGFPIPGESVEPATRN